MADDRKFVNRSSIFVAVRNDRGEYLLQKRINTGWLDGYYDFAASGHLEHGETLQQCAIREAKEEIGITIVEEDLRLVHINQNNIDIPYLNFTFMCEKWMGEPTIAEPEKVEEIRFFAPDQLPDKCTLNVRLLEEQGFSDDITFSYVDPEKFHELTGA